MFTIKGWQVVQQEGKTPKQGQTNARALTYLYRERGSSAVQIKLIAYMYTLIINIYKSLSLSLLSLSKSRVLEHHGHRVPCYKFALYLSRKSFYGDL